MRKHKLEGFAVIVSPKAADAPQMLRSVMAKVTVVKHTNGTDIIHVDFDEKTSGTFSASSLLTLKPLPELRQILNAKGKSVAPEDRKELDKIIKLLELGEQEVALKHAINRKPLQSVCITDCATWMSLQAAHNDRPKKQKPGKH